MLPTDLQTSAMRRRLEADELVVSLAITHARTPDFMMMLATTGVDAVFVDMEHAAISLETCTMLCTTAVAAGLTPLVRVPSHEPQDMTRVLDNGAMGVVVPHVNSRDEAERIVDACRFPPDGHRSIIGPNPVTRFQPMPGTEMTAFMNRETILCAMVETPQAVERSGAIASVPGLDMILIGPHDLTAEMGIPGQFDHKQFRGAVETVAAACREHGKILGIAGVAKNAELLAEFVSHGGRFISAGTDAGIFLDAARTQAARLRSLESLTSSPT